MSKNIYIDMEQQFGHERAERLAAERERTATYSVALEEADSRQRAEQQRDIALYKALNNAHKAQDAERDRERMLSIAIQEAAERRQAEMQATEARMAEQEARMNASQLAAERVALRENLASEREAASNASFGFVFLTCLIVAAFIGLGFWYANISHPNDAQSAPAMTTAMNTRTANAAMSKPPVVIQNPAPVVVTQPTRVIVKEVPVYKTKPATRKVNGEEIQGGAPVNVPDIPASNATPASNTASDATNTSGDTVSDNR